MVLASVFPLSPVECTPPPPPNFSSPALSLRIAPNVGHLPTVHVRAQQSSYKLPLWSRQAIAHRSHCPNDGAESLSVAARLRAPSGPVERV
eukprot:2105053-Prymnesium_polylepis.1